MERTKKERKGKGTAGSNPTGLSRDLQTKMGRLSLISLRHFPTSLCLDPHKFISSKGAFPQNLSYGQLFLKPLFHLNSIPFSFKQGQRFFPIIFRDSSNDHSWLIFALRRHATTCTRTIQTLLDHALGRAKRLLSERKKSGSVIRGAPHTVRSPPP